MSIGPNQVAQFGYLLSRVQEVNFYDTKGQYEEVFSSYTKDGPTDQGADYRSATTVGLAPWQFTTEMGGFHKDAYEPGQERVSRWVKFTNGVVVSFELMTYMMRNKRVRDDKTNMLSDVNQQFRDTWSWTEEIICAQFQTSGTSTTATNLWPGAGRDGLALFSASHTSIKTPVVNCTNLQGAQPLTQLAMQEMVTILRNIVDDTGRPQPGIGKVTFVVGPWWEWRMPEIMGTDKQVDTANNNTNVLTGGGKAANRTKVDYIVNRYLSQTDTSWMAVDEKGHRLMRFEALEPLFESEKDIQTGARIFKATSLFGIDFLSFRGAGLCAGA